MDFQIIEMIAYLSGKILDKSPDSVIVDVGGVGYDVTVPLSTFYELGEAGTDVQLRIYTHVREDAIQLFGFSTEREKQLFLKLISVQGVGARSAITMLSGMKPDEIITALRTENLAKLTAIPGVGKKTAERMIVELRDKIGTLSAAGYPDSGTPGHTSADTPENAIFDDALSALVNLGYKKDAAEKALRQAFKEGTEQNVQKLLRASLQILAK